MRYLVFALLLCFDLFVMASIDGHPIQWLFLAITAVLVIGLTVRAQDKPKTTKELNKNDMDSANAWMLAPVAFFALKLLSNSIYTGLNGDIPKDARGYFFLFGQFGV